MKTDLRTLFSFQHRIFGLCPRCRQLFRLSDCRIFLRRKPQMDWMKRLALEDERLDLRKERLDEKEEEIRELSREKGRKQARKVVRRIDPIFAPRGLNPDDAKVIFHPIDFVVFNGMRAGACIRNVLLLDRTAEGPGRRRLQRSIEKVVERGAYEWATIRVGQDASIKME